jgi:hypothetical protein
MWDLQTLVMLNDRWQNGRWRQEENQEEAEEVEPIQQVQQTEE